MRLLATRPKADGEAIMERLEKDGHTVILEPLLNIRFRETEIDLHGVQALVVTSRNALRAIERAGALDEVRKLPAFVVGPATERLAHDLGFQNVVRGLGDAEGLKGVIERDAQESGGVLLYLTGEDLAFDLLAALEASGFSVRREIVYESVPADAFTVETLAALSGGALDGVILMSPRAASTYAGLVVRHDIEDHAGNLIYFCLSDAVARALVNVARRVEVAQMPNLDEIVELVNRTAQRFV